MARKLFGVVIALGLFFGVRTYNLNSAKKDVRQEMQTLCETDEKCKAAVETHFDVCWDKYSSLGSRHKGPSVDIEKLANCVNASAGEEYFTVTKDE
ncbi:MAG: hypothetical protein HYU52_14325 [Acidobacteria bacterium]|nr:hypothetical protein [Acidobacteriota bacterium]